jgi:uncharacterized membrane protein
MKRIVTVLTGTLAAVVLATGLAAPAHATDPGTVAGKQVCVGGDGYVKWTETDTDGTGTTAEQTSNVDGGTVTRTVEFSDGTTATAIVTTVCPKPASKRTVVKDCGYRNVFKNVYRSHWVLDLGETGLTHWEPLATEKGWRAVRDVRSCGRWFANHPKWIIR